MTTRHDLEQSVADTLDEIRTMRDEIAVQLHLAGMEARTRWETQLEPKVAQAEHLGQQLTEATHHLIREVAFQLKEFRDAIRDTQRASAEITRDRTHAQEGRR